MKTVWALGCMCVMLMTLVGCVVAPPDEQALPPPISDAEIVRRADGLTATAAGYTATAGAVATGNAYATQAVQATANVMATQAQATLDAASRNFTIAQTEAVARQTMDAVILAPTQTVQAAAIMATQIAEDATQAALQREHDNFVSTAWHIAGILLVSGFVGCCCVAVLWAARSHAAKQRSTYAPQTFEHVTIEGVPFYRVWTPEAGWRLFPVFKGLIPKSLMPAPDPLVELRQGWNAAVKKVARAAAETGSWSVNTLSTRKGGLGIASEDAIADVQHIAEQLGAIQNYGSTRGWDWVGEGAYLDLTAALDAGEPYALPTLPGGAVKTPPAVDLSRIPAKQSTAKQSSKAPETPETIIEMSPMGGRRPAG